LLLLLPLLLLPPLLCCACTCNDDSLLPPWLTPLRSLLLLLLLLPSQLHLLSDPLPRPLLSSSVAAGGDSNCLPAPICSSQGKLTRLLRLPAAIAASVDAA
jgi:hypothetical protein